MAEWKNIRNLFVSASLDVSPSLSLRFVPLLLSQSLSSIVGLRAAVGSHQSEHRTDDGQTSQSVMRAN